MNIGHGQLHESKTTFPYNQNKCNPFFIQLYTTLGFRATKLSND